MLLKPLNTPDHKVLAAMNRAFLDYKKTSKVDPKRLATIRASALPFCPRDFLVRAAYPTSDLDAFGAFFTSVGTTVHTWVQDIAGLTGMVLGDWRNRKTGKWRRFSLPPKKNPQDWEYHELEASVLGAIGHCDGVFCTNKSLAKKANKKKSPAKRLAAFVSLKVPLVVIDYKTCTTSAISSKIKQSSDSYILQLLFYCLHFHELGLNVQGYGNFYIPRDNPRKWGMNVLPWDAKKRKYITKKVTKWVAIHRKALNATTWREFNKLYNLGGCTNEYCRVCRSKNAAGIFRKAFDDGSWPLAERL